MCVVHGLVLSFFFFSLIVFFIGLWAIMLRGQDFCRTYRLVCIVAWTSMLLVDTVAVEIFIKKNNRSPPSCDVGKFVETHGFVVLVHTWLVFIVHGFTSFLQKHFYSILFIG